MATVIRRRKRVQKFNPSRSDIQNAMKEYLEKGGKIKKITVDDIRESEISENTNDEDLIG